MIGTPSYDGRIDVWFANSLVATVKEAEKRGIFVHAIYTSYLGKLRHRPNRDAGRGFTSCSHGTKRVAIATEKRE